MRITETAKLHVRDKVLCTNSLMSIRCVNSHKNTMVVSLCVWVSVMYKPISINTK